MTALWIHSRINVYDCLYHTMPLDILNSVLHVQKQVRLLYGHNLHCIYLCRRCLIFTVVVAAVLLAQGHMHRGVDFDFHSPCLLLPALFLLKLAVNLFWWKLTRTTIPTAIVYLAPGVLTGSAPIEVPPPAHLETSMCWRAPGDVSPPDALSNQQHKGGPKMFVSGVYIQVYSASYKIP